MKHFDPFDYPKGRIPDYHGVVNVVLFVDVVGFSKDTTNADMKGVIRKFDDAIDEVLEPHYYWAEKRHKNDLILIPTGDGFAVGFHPNFDSKTVLQVAARLFKTLTGKNGFKIRMGIAKGPNMRFLDWNENVNLFGFGINLAKRVMDCAASNQILVHETFANEVRAAERLDELVEIAERKEIKHGETIKVFNYYKEGEFGSPE